MMKKGKEFDDILTECLDRLLVKDATVEQCLASYPEQADELKPLLQIAMVTRRTATIQPRPDFRARARYQFHAALQEIEGKRGRLFFRWLPQWAAVVTVVLVLLLAGSGTVAAASNSMPDEPLYQVKLATEQVWLTLNFSDMGKARLNAVLADRRVAEIIYLAGKGDARRVEAITKRLDKYLAMMAMLASIPEAESAPAEMAEVPAAAPGKAKGRGNAFGRGNDRADLKMRVAHWAVSHPAALRAALEKAPEEVRAALLRAIAVSEAGYEKALEALD
jgi:hypothetical protein